MNTTGIEKPEVAQTTAHLNSRDVAELDIRNKAGRFR